MQEFDIGRYDSLIQTSVDSIMRVPSRFRRYDQTAGMARKTHGIPGPLLDALLDNGLPHRVAGGVLLFDELDLANASFHLELPSARAMALRSWGGALRSASETTGITYTLGFSAQCPEPGHSGECTITQHHEIASIIGRPTADFPPAGFTVPFVNTQPSILLPAPFRQVTEELANVEYHLLPDGLHEDLGFLKRSGLADCPLAAEYLLRVAVDHGYPARKSFGIFVSMPFSVPHFWVELNIDGGWHAVDPHLLKMLGGRGLIDPDTWPVHRTLGGVTWRLADRDLPLALHNGEEIACSLSTRRV